MATNKEKTEVCIFQWRIENIRQCWWFKVDKSFNSPTFTADATIGTKWSLRLHPMGISDKSFISFNLCRDKDCSGPDTIDVYYQLAFLGKDGSILEKDSREIYRFRKRDFWGFSKFVSRERVFFSEEDLFLPEDILTVQCTFWRIGETQVESLVKYLYTRTILKVNRKSFVWRMDKFNYLKPGFRKEFKDTQFDFDLVLNEGMDGMDMDITSFDENLKYISCITSVINNEGKKENYEIKNYFTTNLMKDELSPMMLFPQTLIENTSLYLLDGAVTLDFEFVFATVEHLDFGENDLKLENDVVKRNECCIEKEISRETNFLSDDLRCMLKYGTFSDAKLRTSTKSFPVHKNILSARSPVFRRMFSNDMKENNNGYVDITDLDNFTLRRMLIYIYTDMLKDLEFKSALKLYFAADKYEILSLREKCSSFLKDNLSLTTVCDILSLADLHQDDNLKNAAQAYVLEHNVVFSSLEWKNIMDSNIKLAADIMYKKLISIKI